MSRARTAWTDVRGTLHARILDGTYRAGDKLPRDVDLAEDLGCARTTVQRAMQDLADSGLVERRRKGGSRVRSDPVTRAVLEIPVVQREIEATGAAYGYRLQRRGLAPASPDVLQRFGLSGPRDMLRVCAVHLADGAPYLAEDRWICPRTVPEILAVDLAVESANAWLVRTTPYSHGTVGFHAVRADAEMSFAMGCDEGTALFAIERTTWIGAEPITTVQSVTRPGYRLQTEI